MIVLFFDTETTGFPNPKNPPEIVQIGAILQDTETMRILGEVNLIVKAEGPIPQVCADIHGITDELSARHGVRSDVADNMFALLAAQADLVVAHNIKFDLAIINGRWRISGPILATKEQYCTMLKSTDIVGLAGSHAGGNKWPKMTEAYKHFFGEVFDGAHDAMADVRACRDVFHKLQETADKQPTLQLQDDRAAKFPGSDGDDE
jgi:DNA polymerase-3 subunit epsilon